MLQKAVLYLTVGPCPQLFGIRFVLALTLRWGACSHLKRLWDDSERVNCKVLLCYVRL